MKIHALWCHPRSVSTAFERIMRERGDLTVLHEPFMYHHYLNSKVRLFPDFTPEPGHPTSYEDICEMIRNKACNGQIFFKDMAYYVVEALLGDEDFSRQMTHAFLLRDPVEAALSYAKRDPNFTCVELGHEAQHRLYRALLAQGQIPLVLTADQLRGDPQNTMRRYWKKIGLEYSHHAFAWDHHVPEEWLPVKGWHSDVLQSRRIQKATPGDAKARLKALGAPYTEYAAHHAPFYDELRCIAESQAHQK